MIGLDSDATDTAVGAVYGLIDVAFRPMMQAGFMKEVQRDETALHKIARENTP